jgi:hypothetical protein
MKERRKAENPAGKQSAQAIRPPYPANRVLKNPPLSISSLFIIIFP